MPAAIFNGNAIKLLKEALRFKSGVEIITNDVDNPTLVAKDAPQGSLYIRSGTGDIYIKQDNGSSTNWNLIGDSADFATKANVTLDNLGTTAINADLLFDSATRNIGSLTNFAFRAFAGHLQSDTHIETGTITGDVTSGSDVITNVTGDQTFFEAGVLVTGTGIPANTLAIRQSANTFRLVSFFLAPVNATATNTGVTITWLTQNGLILRSALKPTTGASGGMSLITGRTVDATSGGLNIQSGSSFAASGTASGSLTVTSGVAANESGNANSGSLSLASGRVFSTGTSGAVVVASGVNNSTGNTGTTSVLTGSTSSGTSGNTNISTGAASSGGTTGNINLTTGTTAGTRGNITATASDINLVASVGAISLNPTTSINVNSKQITSLASPSLGTDAANKDYVDAVAQGVKAKQAVVVATTANITLSGEQTIDGVLTSSSRVLVKNQSTASQNGIYVTAAGAWTRATDFDSITPVDEINGAIVGIMQGTAQEGQIWVNTGGVVTVGTDPINFVYFNSVSTLNAGDGIDITGTTLSVTTDGEGFAFSSGDLVLELDGATLSKSATGLKIADDGITNTQVSASAAIAYTKLNLSSSIVNADISASAAIDLSKLVTLTADRALLSNSSGIIAASSVTNTELGYLSGVTSALQTQINNKLGSTTISQSISFTAAKGINYLVNSSGGPLSVALPVAAGGGWVRIIDVGNAETNIIGIDPDGSETINGALSYTISSNYESVLLISTGTEWIIA